MRSAIALSLALSFMAATSAEAEDAPSTVTVVWPGGSESPGVCVEKPEWFASVIPAGVTLEGLKGATLRRAGSETHGRMLHLDPEERLCLFEAETALDGATPVPFSDSEAARAGVRASCVSGSSACLTTVAGKEWSYRGERFPLPLLRLRVSESGPHCHAGTPLVCDGGRLVGILTGQQPGGKDEVYAIPASRLRKLVEDIKRHNRSGRVWIGLVFHDDSSTPEVVAVKADSPAAEAGIEPGDVILAMDGTEIESLADLVESIHNLPAGETTQFRILRGLEEHSVSVTPRFAVISSVSR